MKKKPAKPKKQRNYVAATEATMTGSRAGIHKAKERSIKLGSSRKVKHKKSLENDNH